MLSHSFIGHEIEDMWLDGKPTGEIGLTHANAVGRLQLNLLRSHACAVGERWPGSRR